jgi:UDP-GlcNAc:undecaprenyl-phosphate GlcNAc-1-phosphate transferase
VTDAILLLLAAAFLLAVPLTLYARAMGNRLNAHDGAGVAGQVKVAARPVPNTGGVTVFGAVTLPLVAFLIAMRLGFDQKMVTLIPDLAPHLDRVRDQAGTYGWLLICLGVLHIMGLIDDRRPLGAMPKLAVMLGVAAMFVIFSGSGTGGGGARVLTMLDAHVGGPWLSIVITVIWIVAVTNALNFIDNMDGLCGGVGAIAGACFMASALIHRQWFVAGVLALLVGGCLGFLVFNFPWRKPATIFLGDGGSLVVGFILATMAIRITYARIDDTALTVANIGGNRWHAVLTPLVVLAVPLYDMLSVTFLRLRQGKSPFVGDLQHLSHRLHFGGLTRRDTVFVICGLTAITAMGGIVLPSVEPWQAGVIFAQTVAALVLLGIWEYRASASARGAGTGR